jgi:molybdopterin synthase sulfur carrier subunit
MLKVVFFAQLKEVLNTEQLDVAADFGSVASLREHLQQKGELWQEYL